jgi:S1-C subfamily serine protease
VVDVTTGGPADSSGVLVGDLILDVDQHPIGSTDDLLALLTTDRVGRQVPVRVLRGGVVTDLTVTVGERKAS